MTDFTAVKIDYDKSILSISNSVLKYFKLPHKYKTLDILDDILNENYTNVVLMIIDGMGSDIIAKNLPEDSFLRKHVVTHVSSVFPPTTAAATTTFHSGLPPIASGWLGWKNYFPQYGKIIEVFRNLEYYTGKPLNEAGPAETIIKYKPIYNRIAEECADVEYHRILPPFEENGVKSFDELCSNLEKEINSTSSRKIISAYWNEPDHSIHECGVTSQTVKKILQEINNRLEELDSKLKDTVVIISADHGALDTEEISLNNYPDLCNMFERPPSLENRCVSFVVKQGQKEIFCQKFNEYFSQEFLLFEKDEFLSAGIFGLGEAHPLINDLIGDFVAVAVGNKALSYTTGEREFKTFKAEHAGYTPMEMQVPLIILKHK